MATRTMLVDDLDGSDATETVHYSLDGTSYSIDLNDKNAEKLRSLLAKYIAVATITDAPKRRRGAAPKVNLDDVRAWAREQGYQVSDRGRVAATIQEAYDQAH